MQKLRDGMGQDVFHIELGQRVDHYVRKHKEEFGTTITQIAIDIGYKGASAKSMLWQVMKGASGMERDKLHRLAEKLGIEPYTLEYPGHLELDELDFFDVVCRVVRNRQEFKDFPMIEEWFRRANRELIEKPTR